MGQETLGPQYKPAAHFCEWDKDNLSYGCTLAVDNSTYLDSDPSRQNLLSCPGSSACQPDCNGKQCGDDGCGGSCGTCPGGNDLLRTVFGPVRR